VADKIDLIVDETIAHTREQLEWSRVDWPVARLGLEKIHDALAIDAPGHPALNRLRDFIDEQDRIRRDH
jgi:hypothetical protein